jgi:hypothetical protein
LSVEEEVLQRAFYEAAGEYFRAFQEAELPELTRESVAQAYADYLTVVQEPWSAPDLQERAFDAYRRYAESMDEAMTADGLAVRATDAYKRYVAALRESWTSVDPAHLGPEALATIAQSMLSVASTAGLCPQVDRSSQRLGDEPEGG